MIIVNARNRQHRVCQPFDDIFGIPIGSYKKSVVPVNVFAGYSTIKHIPLLDEAVQPIYSVQVIKTGILCTTVITILNSTVCNSRKCVVAAQAVTKGKGSVSDMAVKYTDKFRSTGFCPMFAWVSWRRSVKLFSLVVVKDKGLVKFGHASKTDTAYFRKLLQGHKYFVAPIKDCLMGTADSLRSVINGIAMNGVLYNFAPYLCREMGV